MKAKINKINKEEREGEWKKEVTTT